eukprot:1022352-Ditylum_brightwellii.AAC.1
MDDARAELRFQLDECMKAKVGKENNTEGNIPLDVIELQSLLLQAKDACDLWFSLIDENDVRDAENAIKLS